MAIDVLKELGQAAEKALTQEETMSIVGGNAIPDFGKDIINGAIKCMVNINSEIGCPGNVCAPDPRNLGACPGNTIGGGPSTCPLSL